MTEELGLRGKQATTGAKSAQDMLLKQPIQSTMDPRYTRMARETAKDMCYKYTLYVAQVDMHDGRQSPLDILGGEGARRNKWRKLHSKLKSSIREQISDCEIAFLWVLDIRNTEGRRGRVCRALDLLAVFRPVDWVQRGHIYTSRKRGVRLVVRLDGETLLTYLLRLVFGQINTDKVVPMSLCERWVVKTHTEVCTHHILHSAHLIIGEPSSPFVHVQYAVLIGLDDFCFLVVGALEGVVVFLMFSLSDGSAGCGCSCLTETGVAADFRVEFAFALGVGWDSGCGGAGEEVAAAAAAAAAALVRARVVMRERVRCCRSTRENC